MQGDVVVGELSLDADGKRAAGGACGCGGSSGRFAIDLATPDDTRNLYFHLKDAWNAANNMDRPGMQKGVAAGEDEDDDGDESDDEDFKVLTHGAPGGYGSLREARLERDRYLIS